MHRKHRRGFMGILASAVLFVVVMLILSFGTASLSGSADIEGLAATQNAVERAAVLCYATEGFYPPSLAYLEENYGIQVDHARYVVRYEAIASNLMPAIKVVGR